MEVAENNMEKRRLQRILNIIQKHGGVQVFGATNRAEFDFSIVYELLALEDYIQELEHKISKLEVIIADKDIKLKKKKAK